MQQAVLVDSQQKVTFSEDEKFTTQLPLKDLKVLTLGEWDRLSEFLKEQARSIGISP